MVALGTAQTTLIAGPTGPLEILSKGTGPPSTLFVHGLGGSIASTRVFAGATPGRRSFVHIAGHGASSPSPQMTYAALADEVSAAADYVGADAALGVSMGAGALCALVAAEPQRFTALVLVLPAALNSPRIDASLSGTSFNGASDSDMSDNAAAAQRFTRLAALVARRDVEDVAAYLARFEPHDGAAVMAWCREQATALISSQAQAALTQLPRHSPLVDIEALRAVTCPVLVIAQEGDEVHPVSVARRLGEVLPHSRVEVLPQGGIMWAHRDHVRALVGDFLCDAR